MGQRLDNRSVQGKHRVEEMRQADPLCLGDQAEQRAVSVKAPWPADFDDLEPGFVVTVQKLIGDLSGQVSCTSAQALQSQTTAR